MKENTNEKLTDTNISTEEFLAKVEEAAKEGAKQGSKGTRGGSGLFEKLKTIILIAFLFLLIHHLIIVGPVYIAKDEGCLPHCDFSALIKSIEGLFSINVYHLHIL